MPINTNMFQQQPSIPQPDPLGQVGKFVQLKQMQQAGKIQQMQLDKYNRSLELDSVAREILSSESDLDKATMMMLKDPRGGPDGLQYIQEVAKNREALLKADTASLQRAVEAINQMMLIAQTVGSADPESRPELIKNAKGMLANLGVPENVMGVFPDNPDEDTLFKTISGLSTQQKELKDAMDAAKLREAESNADIADMKAGKKKPSAYIEEQIKSEVGLGEKKDLDILAAYAMEKGLNVNELTPQQRTEARKQYELDVAQQKSQFGVIEVNTVDDKGNAVTILTPRKPGTFKSAPTADMRNKEYSLKKTTAAVDLLQKASEDVISQHGLAQRATAAKRAIAAKLGDDPGFRFYQDARLALAGNLAVLQQGSRPSDADIQAIWLPLVPNVFEDTDQSAELKWNYIRTASGLAESQLSDSGGQSNTGMVKLAAPDGTIKEVPEDQAEYYIKKGAKRVP